jgi:Na+-driven multidrug efflux pump
VISAAVLYFCWDRIINIFLEDLDSIADFTKLIQIYIFVIVPNFLQIILGAAVRAIERKKLFHCVDDGSIFIVPFSCILFMFCMGLGRIWVAMGPQFGYVSIFIFNLIFLLLLILENSQMISSGKSTLTR